MASLWNIEGNNIDVGYANLCAAKYDAEKVIKDEINTLWASYEPFADPDFRHGFARDPDARFWEMYVGCRLLEAGKTLLPTVARLKEGGQPDICVIENGRKIWIEAIAADPGAPGPDQVATPKPTNEGGGFGPALKRQAQLRMTSAFWTKSQVVEGYLKNGVIAPEDVRLIAIGAGRFGAYVSECPIPLIISSVFPIGDEYVTIDRETMAVVEQGFHPSLKILRKGPAVDRTAFLDEQFAHISGIVWSRISIGNMSRTVRPLSFVHNPIASVKMQNAWGIWDKEFVTKPNGDSWVVADILAESQN